MGNKSEQNIQKDILEYLKSCSYCVKIMVANKMGIPDIICCIKGLFYAFEVKKPGEKAESIQRYNIDQILRNGGRAFVVSDLKQVIKIIEETK